MTPKASVVVVAWARLVPAIARLSDMLVSIRLAGFQSSATLFLQMYTEAVRSYLMRSSCRARHRLHIMGLVGFVPSSRNSFTGLLTRQNGAKICQRSACSADPATLIPGGHIWLVKAKQPQLGELILVSDSIPYCSNVTSRNTMYGGQFRTRQLWD